MEALRQNMEAEAMKQYASSGPAFDLAIPVVLRWLGARDVEYSHRTKQTDYRMRWGQLVLNKPGFGCELCLFEEGYSLKLHAFRVLAFIRLPFRAGREPHEMMESWGASYHPPELGGLHLHWGRRYKILTPFWRQWEQSAHEVRRPDGMWTPFVGSWEERCERRPDGKEPDGRHLETYPYRYLLQSGEVQERTATIYVERRTRRLKYLPFVRRVSHAISVEFSDEVGERSGSWKGGCVGCGYDLRPGETPRECLKRMERERKF